MALRNLPPGRPQPPLLSRILLAVLARSEEREFILGDLEELWLSRLETEGKRGASLFYWSQVVRSLYYLVGLRFRRKPRVNSDKEQAMLEGSWKDLRHAVRLAWKRPGFSLIVVLTLALGIGANTAVYSLLNAFIFRTLPVPEADRLVSAFNQNPDGTFQQGVSYAQIRDFEEQASTLEGVLGFSLVRASLNHGGVTEMVYGEAVTGNYFAVLRTQPQLGRTFVGDEVDSKGIAPVVVISDGLWQRRFGRDPSILGQTVQLNGVGFSVIGVAPKTFTGSKFALSMHFWIPVQTMPRFQKWEAWDQRSTGWLNCIGRVRKGYSLDEVSSELALISARLSQEHPAEQRGRVARVQWARGVFTELDPSGGSVANVASGLSLGVALAVLLIACANVASLILARSQARVSEMGLRLAIGASRAQLFRQLAFESLVLALIGGLVGVLLAFLGVLGLPLLFPAIPYDVNFPAAPDPAVLLLTLGVTTLTGCLFGLVPLLRIRRDAGLGLQANLTSSRSLQGGWGSRRVLVVLQLAASSLLLIISGLFVRSLGNAQNIDIGLSGANLLLSRIDLQLASFTRETGSAVIPELERKLEAIPAVEAVGLIDNLPLDDSNNGTTVWARSVHLTAEEGVQAEFVVATPGLFSSLGIRLREGRLFTREDREESPPVALVSASLAEQVWPGGTAIGRKISHQSPEGPFWEVVGVLEDVKYRSLGEDRSPAFYLSMYQSYRPSPNVVLKTRTDPSGVVSSLREAIREIHPDIPLFRTTTFQDHISNSVWLARMGAALASIFGAVALLLALIGLYGLMSFVVSQRVREMGIRTALGANPIDLLRLVMVSGSWTVVVGLICGFVISYWIAGPVSTLLYGIAGFDFWTFLAVGGLLLGVALLACYLPARRAARIDPMQALRYE